eukprot:scaffold233280_cov31-Prasinocladus_malaysianus.AAC.1
MDYLKTKVLEPVQSYLRAGLEPTVLARSSAVGFTIGISPLVGEYDRLTAVICTAVSFLDRKLHLAMILIANFCAMPFEVPMIIPFMRLGEKVTGSPPMQLAPKALWQSLKEDPTHVLTAVWHSMLGWPPYVYVEEEEEDVTLPIRPEGTQLSSSVSPRRSRSISPRDM